MIWTTRGEKSSNFFLFFFKDGQNRGNALLLIGLRARHRGLVEGKNALTGQKKGLTCQEKIPLSQKTILIGHYNAPTDRKKNFLCCYNASTGSDISSPRQYGTSLY
jgi:hypothetical protein